MVRIEFLAEIAFDPDFEFEAPYEFEVELAFSDFSILGSDSTSTLDGGFELTESSVNGVNVDTEVRGERLSFTLDCLREDLRNFLIIGGADLATESATIEVRCQDEVCTRLDSYSLGGWLEFRSLEPFVISGDRAPFEGEMEVTGGIADEGIGPSELLIRAVDYTCVELIVDELANDADVAWCTTWDSLPSGVREDCDGLD